MDTETKNKRRGSSETVKQKSTMECNNELRCTEATGTGVFKSGDRETIKEDYKTHRICKITRGFNRTLCREKADRYSLWRSNSDSDLRVIYDRLVATLTKYKRYNMYIIDYEEFVDLIWQRT